MPNASRLRFRPDEPTPFSNDPDTALIPSETVATSLVSCRRTRSTGSEQAANLGAWSRIQSRPVGPISTGQSVGGRAYLAWCCWGPRSGPSWTPRVGLSLSRVVRRAGRSVAPSRLTGDLAAFASAIAALGVAALLVALLGVRFSKVSAAGVSMEGKFDDVAAGMRQVTAPAAGDSGVPETAGATAQPTGSVKEDGSEEPAQLPFQDLSGTELNRLRRQVYDNQRGIFLAHLLGAPKSPGQAYRVAIFVVGHKRPITPEAVEGATIFLGEAWGSQKFEASWSNDGRLGVVVEAFGPFLALGEVRLTTGERVVAHHYVEFAQGELLR